MNFMNRKARYLFVSIALYAAFPPASHAGLQGVVVAIDGGDKVTVLTDERRLTVRLGDIDAPEPGQPFSVRATHSLIRLCLGKPVTVEDVGIDLPRGIFGDVACAGVDAEAEQVRGGMAWVSGDAPTGSALRALEAEARAAGLGLWSDAEPVPPWSWRQAGDTPPQQR